MELKIYSPSEDGFVKEIAWNHEEIKKEVAEKVKYYTNLVYTDDQIPDAKKDRAALNKFVQALEAKRKEIKKQCLAPYEEFERQMKEIIAVVNEPISMIDRQVKEYEQKKRDEKIEKVRELFIAAGFQSFVTLERIFDQRWLNASVSLKKIEESMNDIKMKIGNDVAAINALPEFSFEALEVYKNTLDVSKAIQEGQRLSEIQKRKAAYEEELKRKAVEEAERKKWDESAEPQKTLLSESPTHSVEEKRDTENTDEMAAPEIIMLDFRVWGTREQIMGLRQYLIDNKIKFGKVE